MKPPRRSPPRAAKKITTRPRSGAITPNDPIIGGARPARPKAAAKAPAPHTGTQQHEPRGKAAGEIEMLRKWVFEQLQICTPAGVQKKKAVAHG